MLAERLAAVRAAVARAAHAADRDPAAIELLPVSKGHGLDRVRDALALGLEALGENYVQECEAKAAAVAGVRWHLLGHCQGNKAARAARLFAAVETVDGPALAARLSAARAGLAPLPVLCEVELTGLPGRGGFPPAALRAAFADLRQLPGIRIEGLMTVAAPDAGRAAFAACRALRDELSDRHGVALPVLSMGMSHDFPAAIACGSTRVRLGQALFGARPRR